MKTRWMGIKVARMDIKKGRFNDAGRGLKPRLKRLDASIAFET